MTRAGASWRRSLRFAVAGGLGVGAALLVGCAGAGNPALIPAQNAGQLTNDFDTVAGEVAKGCGPGVKAALDQTRSDLAALPPTIDAGLLARLRSGVATLVSHAPLDCKSTSTTPNRTTTTRTNTNTTTTDAAPTNTNTTTTNTTPTDTTQTFTNTTTTPTGSTPTGPPVPIVPDNGGGVRAPNGQSVPPGVAGGGATAGGTPGGGN